MALCNARQYPWGGLTCTLKPDHDDDHVAEGRINRHTGKAPELGRWPASVEPPAEPDEERGREVKWKRVGPGRYVGRVAGQQLYVMVKVAERWVISGHPSGGIVGSASTVPDGKDVAERNYTERFLKGVQA